MKTVATRGERSHTCVALVVMVTQESETAYGLPADVFSFGVMAYELYYLQATGKVRSTCLSCKHSRFLATHGCRNLFTCPTHVLVAVWLVAVVVQEFYTDDIFDDEAGVMGGLTLVRTPLLATPPTLPSRPESCEIDAVWELLAACMAKDAVNRPTFATVATKIGEAREKTGGALSSWL